MTSKPPRQLFAAKYVARSLSRQGPRWGRFYRSISSLGSRGPQDSALQALAVDRQSRVR